MSQRQLIFDKFKKSSMKNQKYNQPLIHKILFWNQSLYKKIQAK